MLAVRYFCVFWPKSLVSSPRSANRTFTCAYFSGCMIFMAFLPYEVNLILLHQKSVALKLCHDLIARVDG